MNFWKVSLLTAVLLLCVNILSADATTITFQNTGDGPDDYTGTQDTTICKYNPNGNYGNEGGMSVMRGPYESRSLIKFTDIFGTGENQIQDGSSIISATLCLMTNWSQGDTINTHLVTTPWDEEGEDGVTWNSFNVNVPGGKAGMDWENDTVSSQQVPYGWGYVDFDVTSAVSAWSSNPLTNNGLILLGTIDSGYTEFYTEDRATLAQRPLLTVEYEVPAVPEPLSIILLGLGLGISWFRKKFRNR